MLRSFVSIAFRAFAKVPADCMKHLVDNPEMLRQVLLYHVAHGSWFSAGLEDGMSLDSLQDSKLSVTIKEGIRELFEIYCCKKGSNLFVSSRVCCYW